VALLMAIVFGGLFSGLFTATEAGAIGAAGAIVIALATRRLSFALFRRAMIETLQTSASLFIIGVGAAMFTRFLGLTGLSNWLTATVGGLQLGYLELMLIIVAVYLVLGMFMEPFGAMLITLPVFLPILRAQGLDLVWFGVLLVKLLEVGMITPPIGMNVFVIRNVAAKYATLAQNFRGVIPFLAADAVVVAIVIAVPALILFLPGFI
jgi:tripartite ATP-independent transporter DctM subunit